MPTLKSAYGTNNQTITLAAGAATLANNGAQGGTAQDNTTNLFLDALVAVSATIGAGSIGTNPVVNVYAVGSTDGGTTYSDNVAAAPGAVTFTVPPNARLIGVINAAAASTTYKGGPFEVAAAFGGVLPNFWNIVIENKSGLAFTACTANFQGIYGLIA